MMSITKSQGQALVALIGQIRKDWDLPGIAAAIRKASGLGSAADIAVAACRVAANPDCHTPALIAQPGAHWQALPAGKRLAPVMCTEHAAEKAGGCPECVKASVPMPEGFVVPRPVPPKVWHRPPPVTNEDRRDVVRDLADREVGT